MTTLLQCRQLDSQVVYNNGDYETQLDEPIKLDPQDSMTVKSVFIDTKNQDSSEILIAQDTSITLEFGYYIKNFSSDTLAYIDNALTTEIDGDTYVLYTRTAETESKDHIYCKSLAIYGEGGGNWGDCKIEFLYIGLDGKLETKDMELPLQSQTTGDYVLELDFISLKTYHNYNYGMPFTIVAIDRHGKNQPWETFGMQEPSNINLKTNTLFIDSQFKFTTLTKKIDIPKGNYTPDRFVQLINRILTSNEGKNLITNTNSISNSVLLQNIRSFQREDHLTCTLFSLDGKKNNGQINNDLTGIFIGTNTFNLQFNDDIKKFEISQMHMPMYDANGDSIIHTFKNSQEYIVKVLSASGVFLVSQDNDAIFKDILGFDDSILIPNTPVKQTLISGSYVDPTLPIIGSFTIGGNITGQFLGVDALMNKMTVDFINVNNSLTYDEVSNQSTPITALTSYTGSSLTEQGYYLIEVSGITGSQMIGEKKTSNQIKAIVSRYYSVNSYTSGGAETDIPFVNISENPIYVNNVRIRILNPDGSLANNIENDNTVFLSINRQKLIDPYIPPTKFLKKT